MTNDEIYKKGRIGHLNHNLSEEDGFLFAAGDKVTVQAYAPDLMAHLAIPGDAEEEPLPAVLLRVHVDGGIDVWMNPEKVTLSRGFDWLGFLNYYRWWGQEQLAELPGEPFATDTDGDR